MGGTCNFCSGSGAGLRRSSFNVAGPEDVARELDMTHGGGTSERADDSVTPSTDRTDVGIAITDLVTPECGGTSSGEFEV